MIRRKSHILFMKDLLRYGNKLIVFVKKQRGNKKPKIALFTGDVVEK